MPGTSFAPEELAALETRIAATPAWTRWTRRAGRNGEDVITLTVQGDRLAELQVAKTADGYAATGFDGWGLIVCDDFEELLGILATWRPRSSVFAEDQAA